jgi:hypothetical protein
MMASECKSKMMPLRIIENNKKQSTGDNGKHHEKSMRSEPQPPTTTRHRITTQRDNLIWKFETSIHT